MNTGQRVEVRCSYTNGWVPGFVVEEVLRDAYRLRRRSDGAVLPELTSIADVRSDSEPPR